MNKDSGWIKKWITSFNWANKKKLYYKIQYKWEHKCPHKSALTTGATLFSLPSYELTTERKQKKSNIIWARERGWKRHYRLVNLRHGGFGSCSGQHAIVYMWEGLKQFWATPLAEVKLHSINNYFEILLWTQQCFQFTSQSLKCKIKIT